MTSIRTAIHPQTGETLYAIRDVATQLGRAVNVVRRGISPEDQIQLRFGSSRELMFTTKAVATQLGADLSSTRNSDQPDLSKFYVVGPTERFPECWEPLVTVIRLPGRSPMTLRRALYEQHYGVTLSATDPRDKLRPRPRVCWRTWVMGKYEPKVITCCNPEHQTRGFELRPAPSPKPYDPKDDIVEFLVIQLDDELGSDFDPQVWTRERGRQFLADFSWFSGFSPEAVEAALDKLGLTAP